MGSSTVGSSSCDNSCSDKGATGKGEMGMRKARESGIAVSTNGQVGKSMYTFASAIALTMTVVDLRSVICYREMSKKNGTHIVSLHLLLSFRNVSSECQIIVALLISPPSLFLSNYNER